jgi:hypothetical protein
MTATSSNFSQLNQPPSNNLKIFSLKEESMFDLETYTGRLKHFAKMTDMRLIFLTSDKISSYQSKLKDFELHPERYNLSDPNINQELWSAKFGVKSAINSTTGKILPIPARMCAFVPMNVPIGFGLICMPATMFNIVFFNVINQTYNAMMNYANGSGTEESFRYTAISYTLAVVSSISTGMILKKRFSKNAANMNIIQEGVLRILPSGIAGFLNLFFMRSDYFTKGISFKDDKGNIIGISKRCGVKAVIEGGFTRIILPLPLLVNHFLIKGISRMNLPRKLNILIELFLCSLALGLGLPLSIAIFKENSSMKKSWLEEEFKNNKDLKEIEFVYYNKGL